MDPIQALFLQANKKTSSFPPTSRYHKVETAVLEQTDNEPIVYLKRRFVPKPETLSTLQEHLIQQGERLDNIAHQYLGDPELFWQICDGNGVMHPLEITEKTQRIIRITMPQGILGPNV